MYDKEDIPCQRILILCKFSSLFRKAKMLYSENLRPLKSCREESLHTLCRNTLLLKGWSLDKDGKVWKGTEGFLMHCSVNCIFRFHGFCGFIHCVTICNIKEKKKTVAKLSLFNAFRESSGFSLVFTVHGISVWANASFDSALALSFVVNFSTPKVWIAPSLDPVRRIGAGQGLSVTEQSLTWELLQTPTSRRALAGLFSHLCEGWWYFAPWDHMLHTYTPPFPHARHNQWRFLPIVSVNSWGLTIWHQASFAPLLHYLDKMAKIKVSEKVQV